MRTTIEMPDDLLAEAKSRAAVDGISLKTFFLQAVAQRLSPEKTRVRRPPPAIGNPDARPIGVLTPEQIDEAMFG
jgi:hypothetical protein